MILMIRYTEISCCMNEHTGVLISQGLSVHKCVVGMSVLLNLGVLLWQRNVVDVACRGVLLLQE